MNGIKIFLMAGLLMGNVAQANIMVEYNNKEQQSIAQYINETYKINLQESQQIVDIVFQQKEIDPTLLLGLIEHESGFNKNAQSKANAKGLMQVVPRWHQDKIQKVVKKNGGNIHTIKNNIHVGTQILKNEMNKYNNIRRALQAYNGSHSGTKYSHVVLKNQQKFKKLLSEPF